MLAKGSKGEGRGQHFIGLSGEVDKRRHLNKNLKEARKAEIQISEEWEVRAKNTVRAKSLRGGSAWLV